MVSQPVSSIPGSAGWATAPRTAPARRVTAGDHQVTIVGSCFATDAQIAAAATVTADMGQTVRSVMMLPGNYSVVLEGPGRRLAIAHPFALDPLTVGDALTSLNAVDLPTDVWLSALLAGASFPEITTAQSALGQGVVRPGHCVDLDNPQHQVCWWHPPPPSMPLDDAAKAFERALTEAVAARCQGKNEITCDLSGGADSRAVALLAHRHTPASDRIRFVTYASSDGPLNHDLRRAVATAQKYAPGTTHTTLAWSPTFFFAHPNVVPETSRPLETAYTIGRTAAIHEVAAGGVHLSGDGGDGVLLAAPSDAIDLWVSGQRRAAIHELHSIARQHHLNPASLALQLAKRTRTDYPADLALAATREGADIWDGLDLGWARGFSDAPLLTPDIREKSRRAIDSVAARATSISPLRSVHSSFSTLLRTSQALQVHRQVALLHGVDAQYPFFDLAVVEAALGAELSARGSQLGRKALLDETHRTLGIAPEEWSPSKLNTGYEVDFYRGLEANHDHVADLFNHPYLEQRGLVANGALASTVELMRMGARFSPAMLARAYGVEIWLRRRHQQ